MEIALRQKVTLPAVLFRIKQIQNDRTSFSRINKVSNPSALAK